MVTSSNTNSLVKLHCVRLLTIIFCATTCLPIGESLKPFQYTPFPSTAAMEVDYGRIHHVAPAIVTLQILNAVGLFALLTRDFYRNHSLPLVAELGASTLCFMVQAASVALVYAVIPKQLPSYRGGTTGGVIGSNGKLGILDAAATIQVEWDFAAILSLAGLVLLLIHVIWHLIVGIRHIKLRPRVFWEPVRGDYAWYLQSVVTQEADMKMGTYPFGGVGSERAREWIQTGQRPPGL